MAVTVAGIFRVPIPLETRYFWVVLSSVGTSLTMNRSPVQAVLATRYTN